MWHSPKNRIYRYAKIKVIFAGFILLSLTSGCSYIISPLTSKMAQNLSSTILNSDDPKTVADGAPSYLLLVSSFLRDGSGNESLLRSAAVLHSAYAGVFVKDAKRASKMSTHALNYALRAVCISNSDYCNLRKTTFDEFKNVLSTIDEYDVANWYALGATWAGWIQKNSKDWNAVAELARVKIIFKKLLEINPDYKQGGVHLYAAVLSTLLPAALGGKPEVGRKHFERAIVLSKDSNLMAKVLYAEKYAKLVFNKKLHDKLLNEVLKSDPVAHDLTLMNTLAQSRAKELLAASNDYF